MRWTIIINIFIVDDDFSILKLYKKFLEILGYNILDFAYNGEEAVSKFQKYTTKPDLILMDYNMPIKNGIEAMREILRIDKNAKIIIVSGDPTIKNEVILEGAFDFIEKPFDLKNLIMELKQLHKTCIA